MNKKRGNLRWRAPKLVNIVAEGGKTQTGGTETFGCPEVAPEHFFGPARHRLTSHFCNSNVGGTPSQINATTNSQIGVANFNQTSPGPS